MRYLFLLLLFVGSLTVSARKPVGKIVLSNGDSLAMTQKNIDAIVKNTSYDLSLLEQLFLNYEGKDRFTEKGKFIFVFLDSFSKHYYTLFRKAKRQGDYETMLSVNRQSQVIVSYVLNNPKLINNNSKLMRLPRNSEKELALINAAQGCQTTPQISDKGANTVDYELLIKEQREQIELLKKRLEECEGSNSEPSRIKTTKTDGGMNAH